MEKMISVINNSLTNVINGIKAHRAEAEKSLAAIKTEMDEKVLIASQYKTNVEDARSIISSLENEISELEHDLAELNEKFGAKNFKEILAAGNKEINTKIIEKRALISEQNQRIIELTEKAHKLKDELVVLKGKRHTTEEALNKSIVLEKYYETRISDIINYSLEHPNDLESYVEVNTGVSIDVNELEYEDIELEHVDGSVFEEIDEISTKDIDQEIINALVEEIKDDEDSEDETKMDDDVTPGYLDLSMTQQLDSIIMAATNILKEEDKIEKVQDEIIDNSVQLEVAEDEKDEDVVELQVQDDLEMTEIDGASLFVEKPEEKEEVEVSQEIVIPEENDEPLNIDTNVIDESIFNVPSTNFYDLLTECNLDYDRFSEEDLVMLESGFNKDNTIEFINVLKKHNIAISRVYDNVNVLLKVTPQNLDKILSLLEMSDATPSDIGYVFSSFDKIDINILEMQVNINAKRELTEILFEALPYNGESDLVSRLGLSQIEEADFRRHSSLEEFKMMNLFPEIVMSNYNALKALKINNLTECITKHPHRFIFNPDRFNAILDKYDTDDLIRCINKNAAVIDKL